VLGEAAFLKPGLRTREAGFAMYVKAEMARARGIAKALPLPGRRETRDVAG